MTMLAILGRLRNAASPSIVRLTSLISSRRLETYCIDPSIGLDDEQKRWQAAARKFARNEMFPNMSEWNKQEKLPPREILKKAGELGFGAIYCKKDYGGTDLPRLDASIIYEQLAAGCASMAAYMSVHNMCAWLIDRFGSNKLRQQYIPRLATFDIVASFFLTEPKSGDNPTTVETTARLDGDHYVLNGTKLFVLGYDESELYIIIARHEKVKGDGIFCIAIDRDTEGIEITKEVTERYAWKDQIIPHTITFRDCRVPVSNQIGGDVDGLTMARLGINASRVNVASCWLGATQMSIDLAIQRFKNYTAEHGNSSSDKLSDEWELASMGAKLYAARLLVREAARHIQDKTPHVTSSCAMAKLHAETVSKDILNNMLEMYERFGIIKASPMTEYLHDCISHDFVIGSNNEMREIVALDLLSKKTFF